MSAQAHERPEPAGAAPPVAPSRRLRAWLEAGLPPTLLIALLLLAWELAVAQLALPAWLLPAPSQIARSLVTNLALLQGHVAATLYVTMLGLGLALLLGFGLAFAIDASPLLRRTLYPLLVISQTIPVVAIAPLLVVGFGFGPLPKILVVALVTFFPIVVSTVDGLGAADRDMVRLLRAMDADYWALLRWLRLPAALPAVFSGLKIATTYSVIGAVLAEWIGASSGLGVFIARSLRAFRTDQVFVGALVTSLLTLLMVGCVALLEGRLTAWQKGDPR